MKKTKKSLSLFLVLSMIASLCPLPASAAESPSAPTISIEAHALSAAECSTYEITGSNVYGLFFTGDPGVSKTLVMSTVLSYDNTVILPCDSAGTQQVLTNDLLTVTGKFKNTGKDYEQLYSKIPISVFTQNSTTTFECGIKIDDTTQVTVTGPQLMSVLFFKIAGNDVSRLNRSSLKIETAPAALDSVQASASAVYTTSDGAYSYPAISQTMALAMPALTYPNSATKLVPTITTAPTAAAITYGAALSTSVLSGGVASVPGSFAWTRAADKPNAGTATHSVTFTPSDTTNYATATRQVSVTVQPKTLTAAAIAAISSQAYTGKALTPALTVKDGETALTAPTDYTARYTENINAGTANVAISFTGNYSGNATVTFQITPAPSTLTVTAADADYTGSPYDAASHLKVTKSGSNGAVTYQYKTTEGAYTATPPTAVGQYTVQATLAAEGNYSEATATANFAIKPLKDDLILGAITETYTYDGNPKTPTPTVKRGATTLTPGTDYTLSYQNNINAGTATVTATGKGNYAGASGSISFPIAQKELSLLWSSTQGFFYDNTPKAVTVTLSPAPAGLGVSLRYAGSAYPATTAAPVAAGTYTVKATGLTGSGATNYKLAGALETSYTIGKANRNLALSSPAMLLSGDTLGQTIRYTCSNLDESAAPVFTTDSTAVRVTSSGSVIAVANGSATVRITMAETANYHAATPADCTVTAITQAVTAAAVTSSTGADKLSAVVEGSTVRVVGLVTTGSTLTIVPTYADHVVLTVTTPPQNLTVTATEQALKAGSSFVVASSNGTGSKTITYKIDTSAVSLKPAGIVLLPTDKLAGIGQAIAGLGDDIKNAIDTALKSPATKTEGFDAAAAAAALKGALQAKVDKAKEIKEAMGEAEYNITAKITVDITATGYTPATGSTMAHFTADITPKITYTAVNAADGTKSVVLSSKQVLDNADIHAPITVSMALPTGFVANLQTKLIVKHTTQSGAVEYLHAVLSGGAPYVATWQQSSFSPVELYADSRGGNIKFTFYNGDKQTIAYDGTDLGCALPRDSYTKSGYLVTFEGWTIGGTLYPSVDQALLNALDGKTLQAQPKFTETSTGGGGDSSGGGGGGGGGGGATPAPKPKPPVSVLNPDGSITTTVTDPKTGTITVTTLFTDGAQHLVETATDGSVTTTDLRGDGVKTQVVAPVGAPTVTTITVPAALGTTVLSLLSKTANSGTVAAIVEPDGTRRIILKSFYKNGAVTFLLSGNAQVELVDHALSFSDVPADCWYKAPVDFASSRTLMDGTGKGLFSPHAPTTRAMLVTLLHRLEGQPQSGTSTSFADVVPGSYYAPAAHWAKQQGIVLGISGGLHPDEALTREALVTLLWRYSGSPQLMDYPGLAPYRDVDQISSWAMPAMLWAHQTGLISGRSASLLAPGDTASRAEVAALLQRLVEHMVSVQAGAARLNRIPGQ